MRPEQHEKMLGAPGHFRIKAQTSTQGLVDRMSMDTTRILPQDASVIEASTLGLQDSSHTIQKRNHSILALKTHMTGSVNGSASPLIAASSHKYNSIRASTRTKPPIIYSSLHKKTYFNALEKMLMSPEHIGKGEQYSNIEVAN